MHFALTDAADPVRHKVIYVSNDTWPKFQELIQRGSNLWPDAPPEIKEFADLVTTGKILQDYHRQDTSKNSKNKKD